MSRVFDVTELNRYVADYLSADSALMSVSVRGEISGFKKYPSGHLYFSLKDTAAQVSCVAFRGQAEQFGFLPENGMAVIIRGRAGLFERDGRFQLVVYEMQKDGVGDLFAQYERLKSELKSEGLFDPGKKKKIPFLPRRIGVITSSKGAVIYDILQVLSRRYANFDLLLYPSAVQGPTAAKELSDAVCWFDERKNVDVLLIARGGGSMEDLWCFNDRRLAYAIYKTEIPVISAVGHETDFTICDFVSDLRAATPSAAAEMMMPIKQELQSWVWEKSARLHRALSHQISQKSHRLDILKLGLHKNSPKKKTESQYQHLDMLLLRLRYAVENRQKNMKSELEKIILRLDGQSPLKKLSKGYGLVTDASSKCIISQINEVKADQSVRIDLSDGHFFSKVSRVERKECPGLRKG